MKKLILYCLFISLSTTLFSQELYNNFEFDENEKIIWRNINETELTFKELTKEIKLSSNFENIKVGENYINCELKPYPLDYAKYGHKYFTTPFYISGTQLSASVLFEYKDNKYRVTVKNMIFTKNFDDSLGDQGEKHTFKQWVLKDNGKLIKRQFEPGSDIMNKDFKVKTTFNEISNDDNW